MWQVLLHIYLTHLQRITTSDSETGERLQFRLCPQMEYLAIDQPCIRGSRLFSGEI